MKIKSNCKINLSLVIKNKHQNGYHEIDSIFLPVSLCDEIKILTNKRFKEDVVLINNKKVNFTNNICLNVLKKFKEKYSIKDCFKINIKKNIPIGAGLGGGSSNGTAVYCFLLKYYNIKPTIKESVNFLKTIGKDLVFFYMNMPCRFVGEGDKIKQFYPIKLDYSVLIIYPEICIDTKSMYDLIDQNNLLDTKLNCDKLERLLLNKKKLQKCNLYNSFTKIALKIYPKFKELYFDLLRLKVKVFEMSGSGSAVFCLFDNEKERECVYKLLKNKYKVFKCNILNGEINEKN